MANEQTAVVTEKVSGSKAIARFLKVTGLDTPAKDVVAGLKDEGVEVSVGLVNNIKTRIRQNKEEKRERKKRVAVVVVTSPVQGAFDQLLEVKALAQKLGGAAKVREMLDALDKLAS